MSPSLWSQAFSYSRAPHVRRHGPSGYEDYRSYKPWLRDEFTFRCVFCLVRERWCHDGPNGFGVEHLIPKSLRPDLTCDYDNLLYVCNRCNAAKRLSIVLDPCKDALGDHIAVNQDGVMLALTKVGQHVIDAFNLNYSTTRDFRMRKIENLRRWELHGDEDLIMNELTFPVDLPRLDNLRCDNVRPNGLRSSFHAQRRRGELPRTY